MGLRCANIGKNKTTVILALIPGRNPIIVPVMAPANIINISKISIFYLLKNRLANFIGLRKPS